MLWSWMACDQSAATEDLSERLVAELVFESNKKN